VALVEEPRLRLLDGCGSVYELANSAIEAGVKLEEAARRRAPSDALDSDLLDYDPIYGGRSEWRLLPPVDHPGEPARCLISGTGLTHLGSAQNRQAMHAAASEQLTDSMKMFRWGLEGGRPQPGTVGTAPEWFHKGNGTTLRAHREPLEVPPYAEDGGEEAEIAGIYLISSTGQPYRLGMAVGNEFSDHRFEKKNYLYLAASKLRTCSLGPELTIDPEFNSVPVEVSLERAGRAFWTKQFRTGQAEMCHSLENIEHHHFKFEIHRRPGDIHVHFFGTDCLSFGEGIRLEDKDWIQLAFEGFGRPLRNPVQVSKVSASLVRTIPLG
jgi:hypothetical protein